MPYCIIFKDIFPGLSRTLNFNFRDFPGPKLFWNFKEKIQDFPGGVGTNKMTKPWRKSRLPN